MAVDSLFSLYFRDWVENCVEAVEGTSIAELAVVKSLITLWMFVFS